MAESGDRGGEVALQVWGNGGPLPSTSTSSRAERDLLALGATRVRGGRETGFRVFTDPAGHPFCIVFGRAGLT